MADIISPHWHIEFYAPDEAHMRGITKIYASEQTAFQKVEVIQSSHYGKCLILDGHMQSAQGDEFIYHENLVHPAMVTHPNPKKVVIIGGGEGATLYEVLRHKTVEKCWMIDIDQRVVELCDEYMPEWHRGAFKDKRTVLLYEDGRKFLENSNEKFDVIIIDIPEPVEEGPAYMLYTEEFYKMVATKLTENGMVSLQSGCSAEKELRCLAAVHNTLKKVFPLVYSWPANVPSFDIPWSFTMASMKTDPKPMKRDQVDKILKERNVGSLKYYDGETHEGLFFVPKYIRDGFVSLTTIIRDNAPLTYRFMGEEKNAK
ncbi:MAG TPA: polyamine aminopropyltransferase [bacterium]|jgi:spermidine synthase|nr:polyamine aminopropyltransferase [bacterium]